MFLSDIPEKEAVKLRVIEKLPLSIQIEAYNYIHQAKDWPEAFENIIFTINKNMNRLEVFKKLLCHDYNSSIQRKRTRPIEPNPIDKVCLLIRNKNNKKSKIKNHQII